MQQSGSGTFSTLQVLARSLFVPVFVENLCCMAVIPALFFLICMKMFAVFLFSVLMLYAIIDP